MNQEDQWKELGQQLRVDSIRCVANAGSGHPTSAMSSADLGAVLMSKYLRYDFNNPDNSNNDHLIFSKGHASPLLYSMYKAVGAIDDEELLSFRRLGSRMEGHPTPILPWVNVATGSLGQGLPIAVGIALSGKYLDRLPYRVWVLCGDSELAEGSMWEAFEHAALSNLDNLTAIVDVNRLGQRGETMHGWDLSKYSRRARAFGWHAIEIDGHDLRQIDLAYAEATKTSGKPTVIIAKTVKGKGVSVVENKEGVHGKALGDSESAIKELGGMRDVRVCVSPPEKEGWEYRSSVEPYLSTPYSRRIGRRTPNHFMVEAPVSPTYDLGEYVATREAYGKSLEALGGARTDVVALDAEVGNSTFSEFFSKAHPERYFEMYVAEQQMVAAAVGMQVRNWVPFASSFAAFLSRAHDFIRMAAVSRANIKLVGSHAGVSIGEDGPSQMALEDLALFRTIHGSTVLYPADGNQTANLVYQMARLAGVVYLRTTRQATPVLYKSGEHFAIGGSRIVRTTPNDDVTIVAAGITLHEAIKASELLALEAINARVIDLYSIKPIDSITLENAARDTAGIITVEDHWLEGGLGDAVLNVFANIDVRPRVLKLAVTDMPGSGTPEELLREAGIDASTIADAAKRLVSE